MYEKLRGDVAKLKQMEKLSHEDLARMTGYKASTISAFMCGARDSDAVASALRRIINARLFNDE